MYVLGCGCTNITVKVKNYWSHQEYTKEGSYEVSEKIKGQATWVLHSKYSKAIWYSGQSANEWVIGDLSDIGTLKGEIFSATNFLNCFPTLFSISLFLRGHCWREWRQSVEASGRRSSRTARRRPPWRGGGASRTPW